MAVAAVVVPVWLDSRRSNGRINKSRCYVDPDVYKKDVAMNRKWIFAVVSVLAVALVMFPLNLLWVGQSPLHAAVSSLLFGLPALLTAWTPKGRCAGGRAESRRAAGNTGFRTRTGARIALCLRIARCSRIILSLQIAPNQPGESPCWRKSRWGSLFSCWRRCWHTIFRPKASPSELRRQSDSVF